MELVTPTNTNNKNDQGAGDSDIPIIIIRRHGNPFGGFGGLGLNPFFPFGLPRGRNPAPADDTEILAKTPQDSVHPNDIDKFLNHFFGNHGQNNNNNNENNKEGKEDAEGDTKDCGFMCVLLNFDKRIKEIQKDLDAAKKQQEDKQNEIPHDDHNNDTSDAGFDVHNSTYTEKVNSSLCYSYFYTPIL